MGRTNDTVKILAAIQKNMDKKSWPCIYGGCDQHAINSHLLQRHGVLDRVVENGHLYEVKRCDYYIVTRSLKPELHREIVIAVKNEKNASVAVKKFLQFVRKRENL